MGRHRRLGPAALAAAALCGLAAVTGAGAPGPHATSILTPVAASAILSQAPAGETAGAAAPALRRFASCNALRAHMRGQARRIVGPYGLPVAAGSLPVADLARAGTPEAMPAAAPGGAAPAYSGTNLQEAGVDEPDMVKTDGSRLYALSGQVLRVVDVTGDAPRLLGSIDLSRLGAERLFLVDGRVIVLGGTWDMVGRARAAAPAVAAEMSMMPAPGAARTTVAEIDVTDPARMRVLTMIRAQGHLVAARGADGTLRVVVASAPEVPGIVSPVRGGSTEVRIAQAVNRRAVARTRAGDWLPRLTVRRPGAAAATTRVAVGCRGVSRPRAFSGLGMVTVLTIRVGEALAVSDSDAILTDAEVVYASAGSLYVTTPRWVDPASDTGGAAPRGTTLVHRLDTSAAGRTAYRSSGAVRGYPLNQFAMSEHRGDLRIATTEQPGWWGDGERASQSFVTVLSERGGRLVRRGRVGGLGRGERIYSVRFMGDRGYVVTFRQTDPLYALDLSDPAEPRVTGELKINGYSSHLEPVDETLLIGIGQDATAQGRTLGTQVSLFDVSDPATPRRIAQRRLGEGWSEAESDHHAVLYWPASDLLVIPLQTWGDERGRGAFSGAVTLRVTRDGGIGEPGRVSHGPDAGAVRRSVVVGDALYTVSDSGVKASALDGLADRGWAAFN